MPAVVLALSVATIPLMARIVRGAALVVMRQDYIEAARATGMGDGRLMLRHLAPNCLSPIFVFATLRFGQVILLGSALSFLGLGAQPPVAELGAMASEGRNFLFFAPHIAVIPCVMTFVLRSTRMLTPPPLRRGCCRSVCRPRAVPSRRRR